MSQAMTPVDFKPKFNNDTGAAVWSKGGSWPAWLALSAVGVMSGTPPGAGSNPSCWVICTETGKGSAVSNVFSVTSTLTLTAAAAPPHEEKKNGKTTAAKR